MFNLFLGPLTQLLQSLRDNFVSILKNKVEVNLDLRSRFSTAPLSEIKVRHCDVSKLLKGILIHLQSLTQEQVESA